MYQNKRVLVTGGTGMVGQPLVKKLLERGATVHIASMDAVARCPVGATFWMGNLMNPDFCRNIVQGMDYVFHVAGIKGSVSLGKKRAASFFTPIILMNTNMMDAAYRAGVERYLYTSSVGVYPPADVFNEDDAWKGEPYEVDRYAGWAKRMGELQAEAYALEYGWNNITIVRPTNIYGPYDNFDPATAMVIPALIARIAAGENPLVVWGDGSPVRDFLYADDCADGMLLAMERGSGGTFNLGGNHRTSIKEIATMINNCFGGKTELVFDASKQSGQAVRVVNTLRAMNHLGFLPAHTIGMGITNTVLWYLENKLEGVRRYNVFNEKAFLT